MGYLMQGSYQEKDRNNQKAGMQRVVHRKTERSNNATSQENSQSCSLSQSREPATQLQFCLLSGRRDEKHNAHHIFPGVVALTNLPSIDADIRGFGRDGPVLSLKISHESLD